MRKKLDPTIRQLAYKYECFPDEPQKAFIAQSIGCCRKVWNYFLGHILDQVKSGTLTPEDLYVIKEKTVKGKTYRNIYNNANLWNQISKDLTALKELPEFNYLNDVNSQALIFVIHDTMPQAFLRWAQWREWAKDKDNYAKYSRSFNKRQKRDPLLVPSIRDELRFPQFKEHGGLGAGSFTGQNNTLSTQNRFVVKDSYGWLTLPKFKEAKIGQIKFEYHRPCVGKLGKVSITKTPSGRYYVSLFVSQVIDPPTVVTCPAVAMELGTDPYAKLSDGQAFVLPKQEWRESKLERLKVLDKRITKRRKSNPQFDRKKPSKRYQKLLLLRNRLQERVINQRRCWQHEVSRQIVNQYPVVQTPKEKLAKRARKEGSLIRNQAWAEFKTMVKYKSNWVGGDLQEM